MSHPLDTEQVTRAMLKSGRPRTVSAMRGGKVGHDEATAAARVTLAQYDPRPTTRGECLPGGANEMRPCPYATCRWHLAVDVSPRTGGLKLNFPDVDIADMPETCALDVADRDGLTLEEVGAITNLTRERVRQVEAAALAAIASTTSESAFDVADEGPGLPSPPGFRRAA